ncbi:hypothetical protein [Spirosoma pollinicola]|uniref:Uncharacterized protein n=1 Tax=Spirosoma pollinicola TaxID=2057025 RepID=A0A2K8YUZ7_9BACT|nr:hypothetical protein [Spirosoma pollinicola]AUD01446.1 hypothetical protein CWM47_06250 [Spirosoma pollinicola]
MDSEETEAFIRGLAYEWAKVELPSGGLNYADYLEAITGLDLETDDLNRTSLIFRAIINQAKALAYSSRWVKSELKFETQAEAIGDRARWLRVHIAINGASDDSLDLYMIRANRFVLTLID